MINGLQFVRLAYCAASYAVEALFERLANHRPIVGGIFAAVAPTNWENGLFGGASRCLCGGSAPERSPNCVEGNRSTVDGVVLVMQRRDTNRDIG